MKYLPLWVLWDLDVVNKFWAADPVRPCSLLDAGIKNKILESKFHYFWTRHPIMANSRIGSAGLLCPVRLPGLCGKSKYLIFKIVKSCFLYCKVSSALSQPLIFLCICLWVYVFLPIKVNCFWLPFVQNACIWISYYIFIIYKTYPNFYLLCNSFKK